MSASKADVAEWMMEQVRARGVLYQEHAVADMTEQFGSKFVYENDNGNPAIDKGVLREFSKLKKAEGVEWNSSDKSWSSY